MDEITIPAGLVKVDAPDTLQGYALVVPDSPEHARYVSEPAPSEPAPKKKA